MGAFLVLAGLSAAADPEAAPARGPRTVKIDLFQLDPRTHIWGTDWKITALEQWTAVLACAPVAEDIERCRFVGGTAYSVVLAEDTTKVHSVALPAPGEIDLRWTPRGRVKSWDVIGDRTAFSTHASDAVARLTFHRSDMVYKADQYRETGKYLEDALTRGLAGALEWELPKTDFAKGTTWKPTQTPWIARRWMDATSSPKLECTSTPIPGGKSVAVDMRGTVTEQSADLTIPATVTTTVLGAGVWDGTVGGLVEVYVETSAVASGTWQLMGHARTIAIVQPWSDGMPTTPADMPLLRLP